MTKKHVPSDRRIVGTLIRVKAAEGYGFIDPDDESLPDFFVNITSFADRNDFQEGKRVSFVPGIPRNAPPAVHVVALDPA